MTKSMLPPGALALLQPVAPRGKEVADGLEGLIARISRG